MFVQQLGFEISKSTVSKTLWYTGLLMFLLGNYIHFVEESLFRLLGDPRSLAAQIAHGPLQCITLEAWQTGKERL